MDWRGKIVLFIKVFGSVVISGMLLLSLYSAISGSMNPIVDVIDFSSIALSDFFETEKETFESKSEIKRLEKEDREVKILFAGDIQFDENYSIMYKLKARGGELSAAFSDELIYRMQTADIFMINNEFTFTNRGDPTPNKKFTFRANPDSVRYFTQMGVDVVSVANNHIYDYGEVSLLDTLDTLEKADIQYTGAGRNLDEAMSPVFFEVGGTRIAFISATQIEKYAVPDTKAATMNSPGVLRCYEPEKLLEVIDIAKKDSDFVVLYIHWGTESQEEIDWLQRVHAPIYANAGVDLIIGDHPHCLQKIDVVSGVPVVYSMGNFLFNSKTQNTCMVEATVRKGELCNLKFIPCLQSDCRTVELGGSEAIELIRHIDDISPNISINDEGEIAWK